MDDSLFSTTLGYSSKFSMASGSKKIIIAALIGNALISITKFVAASITGSSAMLSEGIHSVVDTGNQILLLYGLKRAAQPASPQFPFGHGKEIYLWSFVVAILIFSVGAGVSIYEGVYHIRHPSALHDPTINYIVLGLAMIFEGGALYFALKEFNKVRGPYSYVEAVQRGKDPSMFVVLFEDCAAMLGLFVALAGIILAQITGDPLWDGVASVIIGLILAFTAAWLAHETKGLLIGEAANKDIVEGIHKIASEQESIEKINEVLTLHMGPEFILVNMSISFKSHLPVGNIEKAIEIITRNIKEEFPIAKKIFIEAESAK
ncbi:cation diffusion facilitator family transporter [Nitrosomonadaceae bacterium]|nr:cation diffusion facilitator family transporter [Nitrosomonadaceae bacterium]